MAESKTKYRVGCGIFQNFQYGEPEIQKGRQERAQESNFSQRAQMPHKIVCCSEIPDPSWRWIEPQLSDMGLSFEFVSCVPRNWLERHFSPLNLGRLRGCIQSVILAKRTNAAVLVTHGPTLAAWCGLFARVLGLKSKLIAHSFNFTVLPTGLKRHFFRTGLRRPERFVTFSEVEKDVYSGYFSLPKSKFDFVHWGVQPPKIIGPPLDDSKYVCAIGGNARDYATLIEAAKRLPQIAVHIVGRKSNFEKLEIPPNVTISVDLSLEKAMNLLNFSAFMVLPLNSSKVPCGHVTLVAAMHLGKAMVVTSSVGIDDYILTGKNALTFAVNDVEALARSIQRLWNDPAYCEQLGKNGKVFASENCTEQRISDHFVRCLSLLPITPLLASNALSNNS